MAAISQEENKLSDLCLLLNNFEWIESFHHHQQQQQYFFFLPLTSDYRIMKRVFMQKYTRNLS
jgi:hypothetical protein